MKFSIITVSYNAGDTIEDTIKSVLSQKDVDVQYIIIDGASSDDTMEVVDRYRDQLDVVISEPDNGIYSGMNKGLTYANGDIVAFLNADDVYADDNVLDRIATVFDQHNVDACYGDLVYVDKNQPDRIVRYWKSRKFKKGLFKTGWMPAHPTFFAKKELYDKFGNFDEQFSLQSDFDLTMRFMELHDIRTDYLPEILVRMKMGGESNRKLSNVVRGNLEAYRSCKKNGLSVSYLFILRKLLSRVPQFFRKPL
jgi:glycosyltransferase involved in cell wall biosynthesis